jgi:hypothetical protein
LEPLALVAHGGGGEFIRLLPCRSAVELMDAGAFLAEIGALGTFHLGCALRFHDFSTVHLAFLFLVFMQVQTECIFYEPLE